MCYAMMCYVSHDMCTLHCPLLLDPASLSVRGYVGVGVLLCTHTHTYSINYSTTLIIITIIIIIIHIIQYTYTTTIRIPNMIFVYIILYHVKRLCYIPALVYITIYYTICICIPYPTVIYIWLCTITSHTTLIYYTINYYDNSNCYLFLLLCCCYTCIWVCIMICYLSCVCSLVCVCPRVCSYMCICVCLPRLTLLDCAVVKRLMCWYRGVYFGKKFLQNLENGYTT